MRAAAHFSRVAAAKKTQSPVTAPLADRVTIIAMRRTTVTIYAKTLTICLVGYCGSDLLRRNHDRHLFGRGFLRC